MKSLYFDKKIETSEAIQRRWEKVGFIITSLIIGTKRAESWASTFTSVYSTCDRLEGTITLLH